MPGTHPSASESASLASSGGPADAGRAEERGIVELFAAIGVGLAVWLAAGVAVCLALFQP